ncbi:MAG: RNA polymerase sigma factor [Gaiellaceae bacterium]
MSGEDHRLAELEELYRARFTHFLRVAIAITGDYEQRLDAVQEAFGNCIRSRATFRGQGTLEAWLWRAVVNASRDVRRVTGDRALLWDSDVRSNGRPEGFRELRAAVAALPERQRLVLFLRYYADLDYRSIAGALGIRTGTVSATLNAAHGALRRMLQEVEQ